MKQLILYLALSLLLGGCASFQAKLDERTAKVADAQANLKKEEATPEQEVQIGRESASMLLGAAPLVQSKEMMQYINSLGTWIAQQTGRPDINWRFGILNSPNVNAFAAPDGYIFVTKGLIRRLNNEAELAGVIAHEIGHVIKRHYIVALRKKDEAGALGKLASATVEVVGIKGTAVTPMFNLAQNMYSSGLDKTDEYEADRLGVVYAARAGYDPYGLPRVLSVYAANSGGEGFELLFSTHPSPQDRLTELGKAMGNKFVAYESTGLNDSTTFKTIVTLAKAYPDPPKAKPAPAEKSPKK